MPAQHKRPGRKAKEARRARALEREQKKVEQQKLWAARRAAVIVHYPKRWDPEYVDELSPGQCVAWADGGNLI